MTTAFSAIASSSATTSQTNTDKIGKGLGSLDATDFLKLLTAQMQYQDPTAPMDNKDMLAQMAQFSSLSTSSEMNSTLKAIASKLDAIDAFVKANVKTEAETEATDTTAETDTETETAAGTGTGTTTTASNTNPGSTGTA